MAKGEVSRSEMAHARQMDGINVVFDQNSPTLSRSCSQSSCDSSRSSGSGRYRGRSSHRGRYRSSSSSSSSSASSSSSTSKSSSRSRSRSHPRCHRRSSRCGCNGHPRYGRHRRSPPRRYRAHSRSYSRSPSPDRYSRRRRYRSRSRSSNRSSRYRSAVSRLRSEFSRSPAKSSRSRSRSRSSGRSLSLSVDDKRELLKTAKANAMKILGVEKLELPESVKPILSEQPEQSVESKQVSPEPETRVRQDPEKTLSQSDQAESDDISNPKMSPKRRIISFSINNSVAKPTVAAPSCAKVTPRVDSYESRKPYGHWVPVKSRQSSSARKHTLTMSR